MAEDVQRQMGVTCVVSQSLSQACVSRSVATRVSITLLTLRQETGQVYLTGAAASVFATRRG